MHPREGLQLRRHLRHRLMPVPLQRTLWRHGRHCFPDLARLDLLLELLLSLLWPQARSSTRRRLASRLTGRHQCWLQWVYQRLLFHLLHRTARPPGWLRLGCGTPLQRLAYGRGRVGIAVSILATTETMATAT